MASIIRIKRSTTAGDPTTLGNGELAYSAADSGVVAGGDRLYVGIGAEISGNAATHIVIGGKYFTDMLDHAKGTLTASSAIITDSNSKIDNLKVDNLDLNGNTISSTDANGDVVLAPNGTGKLVLNNPYVNGTTDTLVEYIQDTVNSTFVDGEGIDLTYNDGANTYTISAEDATDTNKGIASFSSQDFLVTSGAVTLKSEAIEDIVGGMVTSNTESGITVSYDDGTGKLNFDVNDPTITIDGDADGTATMTNLGNTTISVTLDTVNSNVGTFGSGSAIPSITVNAKGLITGVTTNNISTSLSIASDAGQGTDTIVLGTDTLTFAGGEGIDTAINSATNTVTISAEDATSANKGVASFATSGFTVTAGVVTLADSVVKAVTTDSGAMSMGGNAISILGGEGVDVTHAGTTITVTGEYASGANAGIASFSATNFDVSNVGDVTIKAGGVANSKLANSSVTIGSSSVSLGATQTSLAGLTELAVDNININGNTISSTDTNGNIVLDPNGTGTIDASAARITNLAEPTTDSDAATKYYVDAARSGLDVKNSVKAATTANITLSNTQTVDGVALSVGDRVLVKDQSTASQNGIYVVASGAWTRSTDADAPAELNPGTFVFVEQGTINDNTGFVVVSDSVVTIGTDAINWTLFSSSGTLIAGNGLTKNGYTLEVNVSGTGGIEISSDALQLKSSVAGTGLDYASGVLSLETTLAGLGLTYTAGVIDLNVAGSGGLELDGSDALQLKSTVAGAGLTLASGVLDVVGTADRITANANSIDIASTYVGQSTITTLGTITTGTWQGSVIAALYGGTGQSSYSVGDLLVASGASALSKLTVGTNGKILQSNGTTVVYGDIDGGSF